MNELTYIYSNTNQGAIECFRGLANEAVETQNATARPDPHHRGVWELSGLVLDGVTGRAIVYMAGYEGRTMNDFETDLEGPVE